MGEWEVKLPPKKRGPAFQVNGIGRSYKPELDRLESPSVLDITWAAGVYEGEGSCFSSTPRNVTVTVSQKDEWLLERLRVYFGGRVHVTTKKSRHRGIHEWKAHGQRAVDFLTEIYLYLSPRRQAQILKLYPWQACLEGE